MLEKLESESGWPTVSQIENQLSKLYAPAIGAEETPVEVLTLHKAKGLEWDVVLLPGLHRFGRKNDSRLAEWMEQVLPDVDEETVAMRSVEFCWRRSSMRRRSEEAISKWIREASAERDREELKRLLYVGCTRARQEVHLFGECREGKNGLGSVRRQTLLHTAWPVAEASFVRHWRAQQDLAGTGAKIVEMPAPADISTDWARARASLGKWIRLQPPKICPTPIELCRWQTFSVYAPTGMRPPRSRTFQCRPHRRGRKQSAILTRMTTHRHFCGRRVRGEQECSVLCCTRF